MPVNLNDSLAWKTATGDSLAMLKQLQPNILKGHVREHMQILFIQFSDEAQARTFLGKVARKMKSANKHLREVERFKADGTPGTPYIGVGLTRAGYSKLGIPAAKVPGSAKPSAIPFRRGMRHADSVGTLGDPPVASWEETFRHTIHAVVVIGDAKKANVTATRAEINAFFTPKVKLLGVETGRGQTNTHGDGIEHFGYVDGRSQPLFLDEDIADEPHTPAGWDPTFTLGRVLVRDSAAPNPAQHFGSFFIFRKLEQNVRRFHLAEKALADELGLTGADRPRAGATIVGRFRDGTPLTSQATDGVHPVPNDFDYDNDVQGRKCPLHGAHPQDQPARIRRRREPRRASASTSWPVAARPSGRAATTSMPTLPASARPTGGVGLLFMAFNSELSNQFDFTQSTWANNPAFPIGGSAPGVDQVMGHGTRPKTKCPVAWNGAATKTVNAAPQAVTMKGGEYFFMPSIAFLKAL